MSSWSAEVEHLDPVVARAPDALRDEVDADDLAGAAVLGDARRHVADRAEAEDRDRAALGDVAYSTACQAVGRTSER